MIRMGKDMWRTKDSLGNIVVPNLGGVSHDQQHKETTTSGWRHHILEGKLEYTCKN